MAGAAHIRVEVRTLAGSDSMLTAQRVAMRRRGRRLALVVVPLLALTLVASVAELIRDAEGAVLETVLISIGTVLLIGVITAWLMRRKKRRAMNVPGRLWLSRHAFYPGPYDRDGDLGLVGSARFARRHTGQAPTPIVRLVLTPTALVVVPTQGKHELFECPLSEISTMVVTRAGRRDSGLTVSGRDGRTATFVVEPDDQFIGELQRLGAVLT